MRAEDKEQQSPMARFRRSRLRVSDLRDQHWCEQQLEFTLERGREQSPEMREGSRRHRQLHEEIAELVPVTAETREDRWAIHFLNGVAALESIDELGLGRELPVLGAVGDVWMVGVIDELRRGTEGRLVLIDTKTRRRPSLPAAPQKESTHLQMMLYHRLLTETVEGRFPLERFWTEHRVDRDAPLSEELMALASPELSSVRSLNALIPRVLAVFERFEAPAPELSVRYEWQQDQSLLGVDRFRFVDAWLEARVSSQLRWWRGDRATRGVTPREGWKCRYCPFSDDCPLRPA